MQKMKDAYNETIGLQGTVPRGRPAGRGRVWGEAAVGTDQMLGASPGYSMRFWMMSKPAGKQQSQVLQ